MHEKIKPANKLVIFVTESHYFLYFFKIKTVKLTFWCSFLGYEGYEVSLQSNAHSSIQSSASVYLLSVTVLSIPLKSRWPEFKVCQVLVSSGVLGFFCVGVQKICNFYLKRWLYSGFSGSLFPNGVGSVFHWVHAGWAGGWEGDDNHAQVCCCLMGLSPVSPPAWFPSVWWLTAAVTRAGSRELLVCYSWFGKRTPVLSGVLFGC